MKLGLLIQDNIKAVKLITAWLIFVAAFSLSAFLGDFVFSDKDPTFVIVLVVAIRALILAALSIFNVYWMVPFIKWMGEDKYARQFGAAGIGFFGLVMCCPLMAAMNGMGLAVGLIAALTGMHTMVRGRNFKEQ